MQTSKQAPPQHKNDSEDEIIASKISRTLWESSNLEMTERRSNKEKSFQINQNQIVAYPAAVENPKGLIKEIFRPMKVHNLKVLKDLHFHLGRGNFWRLGRKPVVYMQKLGANIASQFKHLQKLHLVLSHDIDGENLQELGIQIGRNLSNLRCLKVDFHSPYFSHNFHVKDLQIFISEICKNLTNLKKLRFDFNIPEGMTEEALRGLTHDICRYLRKLQHFSFHCPSQGPKDEDIERFLLDVGSSFPKLEALELNFEGVAEFGNKSREGLSFLLGQHSNRLKSLSLSFGSNRSYAFSKSSCLNEEDYEKMLKGITTRLKDLQKLKLKLKGDLIKGIKNITKHMLKSLSKLTHFSLYADNWMTDQGLKDIGTAFKARKTPLHQLKLEVTSSQNVSNEGFEILTGAIANHLPDLQGLELNFPDCKSIGSNALRSLALKVIKPCFMLKNLKLNFSRCRRIKGKGLEEFLIEIANRQERLESVNLVLEHIGDFGKSEDKINELLASCPLIKWKINNY